MPSGKGYQQNKYAPVGPYHINHFICFFNLLGNSVTPGQETSVAENLTLIFYQNFCEIFSRKNIARAQIGIKGKDKFDGGTSVEFTLGGNDGDATQSTIGFAHPDWVCLKTDPPHNIEEIKGGKEGGIKSFYGNTLRRLWTTKVEDAFIKDDYIDALLLLVLPPPIGVVAATSVDKEDILIINSHHFLAGTRSWKIGYSEKQKCFFVETIAIERYSHWAYEKIDYLHSTRNDILMLWGNLLCNFINTDSISDYKFSSTPAPQEYLKMLGYKESKVMSDICQKQWEIESSYWKSHMLNGRDDNKTMDSAFHKLFVSLKSSHKVSGLFPATITSPA